MINIRFVTRPTIYWNEDTRTVHVIGVPRRPRTFREHVFRELARLIPDSMDLPQVIFVPSAKR